MSRIFSSFFDILITILYMVNIIARTTTGKESAITMIKWLFVIALVACVLCYCGIIRKKKVKNKKIEFTGFGYNENEKIFYSVHNPWQKKYGYCKLYDEAAPAAGIIIESEPIYFEAMGKSWLIEFWKGQYGITCGAEIGIYNRKIKKGVKPQDILYSAVKKKEEIPLVFLLCRKSKDFFSRKEIHWWLTGFKLGVFSEPEELVLNAVLSIENKEIREAFVEALRKKGYNESNMEVSGKDIYVCFNKPYSKQPKSVKMLRGAVQQNNKFFCGEYQRLTGGNLPTKKQLRKIRKTNPALFKQINFCRRFSLRAFIKAWVKS